MKNIRTQLPIEWLVCPVTKSRMVLHEETLISNFGQFRKDNQFGFWNFIPEGLKEIQNEQWQTWKHLQENGLVTYQQDPKNNLGIGKRSDFLRFSGFCDFSGLILDIGCGPQIIPSHMEYCDKPDVFFVGIDPLIGEQPRQFAFVQGLGEYLPFKKDLFDQVLFVTSLDHFIDPKIPLSEAKRVVKENGQICIWIGEKDKKSPKTSKTYGWYEDLFVPDGAEDKFHYKRLDGITVENSLSDLGLLIIDKEIDIVNQWRKNLFYKTKKK